MTEQEQIDKWREEFEKNLIEKDPIYPIEIHKNGVYKDRDVYYMWLGFLLAKQNMPVVELPRLVGKNFDDWGKGYICGESNYQNKLIENLDKAGIKYKKN